MAKNNDKNSKKGNGGSRKTNQELINRDKKLTRRIKAAKNNNKENRVETLKDKRGNVREKLRNRDRKLTNRIQKAQKNDRPKKVSRLKERRRDIRKRIGKPQEGVRTTQPVSDEKTQVDATKRKLYSGTGRYGELPRRDSQGNYSWVLEDGTVYEQPGFALDEGSTGWEYLGEHSDAEWTSAEALYKTQPPPQAFSTMNDFQKQEYIDKAHKEMSQNFMKAVAEGKQDVIYELGTALQSYAQTMESEDIAMDSDIKTAVQSMEAAGLSFTGIAREELGDLYAASGVMSSSDRARVMQNIVEINAIRQGKIDPGTGEVVATNMPKPAGIDDPNLTDAEREQKWKDFFETDEWKGYTANVDAMAGTNTQEIGIVGSGEYGLGDQMSRFEGTRAYEGRLLKEHRLIQEGSRSEFNRNIRDIGTNTEGILGSNNLQNIQFPSIGGRQIFRPGQNIMGTEQQAYLGGGGNYGSGIYGRANELGGKSAEQYSYTFNV